MTHGVGMTKSDIGGVIGPEAGAADCDAMTIAFAPGEIEHIAHDHVFVGVMRPHPIGGMNRFVIETFEIDRVRAIDGDSAGIDVTGNGIDKAEVFVLVLAAE